MTFINARCGGLIQQQLSNCLKGCHMARGCEEPNLTSNKRQHLQNKPNMKMRLQVTHAPG